MVDSRPTDAQEESGRPEDAVRERILDAAYTAFTKHGYANTSTLEIATRARVSKRELYALVGNKREMLVACIMDRVVRMRPPPDMPAPADRRGLAAALAAFGSVLLREISETKVIAVFRLAVAEAERSPEVAEAIETLGRRASMGAVAEMLAGAQAKGLLDAGDPAEMAEQFMSLLWGSRLIGLLMRIEQAPDEAEIKRRAEAAAADFLTLHPAP